MNNIMRSLGLAAGMSVVFPAMAASVPKTELPLAEPVPETGLALNLQSAQIIGTENSINMHRVPITNIVTGQTTYKDVVVEFFLDPSGSLIVQSISTQEISPPLNTLTLIPGRYIGPGGYAYKLFGPVLLEDNRRVWTLECTTTDCHTTMNLVTGSPVGHPMISSKDHAQQLPPGFTYGTVGQEPPRDNTFFVNYNRNELIGVQQIKNTLRVVLFDVGRTVPRISVTLHLMQGAAEGPASPPSGP